MKAPSFFDVEDEDEPETVTVPTQPEWQEVPQAVYDSWSRARRLTYCAARDLDAVATTIVPDAQFFHQRHDMYQEMIRCEKTKCMADISTRPSIPTPAQ